MEEVAIIGGGIGGLTFALELHSRGIPFRVYEAAPEFRPLGVGLNLLPHAVRTLTRLGLVDTLLEHGIETREYRFYTRNGQLVQTELRGRYADLPFPQISIHRGDFHGALFDAVRERCGEDAIVFDRSATHVAQDDDAAIISFKSTSTNAAVEPIRATIAISCDGVHSVAREQFHPDEAKPRYEGTMQYRGVTRWPPFLGGNTMLYFGTQKLGVAIIYPIRDSIDEDGRQLINWVVELERPDASTRRVWNEESSIDNFIENFKDANFDFLNIEEMMKAADLVFQYPMVDQDPLTRWTEGRITLLGDAAHPMMPRGSNGGAQAIIDATTLAELLETRDDWVEALVEYERIRLAATSGVVMAARGKSPDAILRVVEERTEGKPFERIEDVVSKEEMLEWQARYKRIAGFTHKDLTT